MKWKLTEGDKVKGKAVSDAGYTMTWSKCEHGIFYNAWTPEPNKRVLSAGYDKAHVLASCERHADVWGKKS